MTMWFSTKNNLRLNTNNVWLKKNSLANNIKRSDTALFRRLFVNIRELSTVHSCQS